ncbi:MAG: hypothetical protein IKI69_00675 [Oscillospiraceae bacterium]|nr:hypothetical protein [Oscillospiraceae bacterium]
MNIISTEKITINVNTADLGKIDLLIHEGYYASRTEFIKNAIKMQLDKSDDDIKKLLVMENKKDWFVGVSVLTVDELQAMKRRGQVKAIRGMGLLVIDKDVSLDLMKDTISAIETYGVCRCDKAIKQYYGI